MLDRLFPERGPNHHVTYNAGFCTLAKIPETENHILQIEISRYLTNQLLLDELKTQGKYEKDFDNAASGFDSWLLKHLQQFVKNDFEEFNSKPYQGFTLTALQVLYSHAREPRVATAARILLDYLSAKYAIQNHGLRRSVPFKRKQIYHDTTDLLSGDAESARFAVLTGHYPNYDLLPKPFEPHYGEGVMIRTAVSGYRLPDLITDLAIRKDRGPYLERFRHRGVEIYWSSPHFEISAGGVFDDYPDVKRGENDAWAVPTTLLPSRSGYDRKDLIRFDGSDDPKDRNNTCVGPGFACGLNPVIPQSVPETCIERRGRWTFFRFDDAGCPLRSGFHAALYTEPCDSSRCRDRGKSFGALEAAEARPGFDFDRFKESVIAAHGTADFQSDKENLYVTTDGTKIRFVPVPKGQWEYALRSVGEGAQVTDMKRWPLASGPVLDADGKGNVTIRNPWLGQELRMSLENPELPRWELKTDANP